MDCRSLVCEDGGSVRGHVRDDDPGDGDMGERAGGEAGVRTRLS